MEESNKESSKDDLNLRRQTAYSHALDLLRYEGEMLWTILSAYMVVNTILVGFITTVIAEEDHKSYLPSAFASILGIFLSIPWYSTFVRNSQYYKFRMDQAKALEDKDFPLLTGIGHEFAEGGRVEIDGKVHHIKCFADRLRNKRAAFMMIFLFVIIYLAVIVYCLSKQ